MREPSSGGRLAELTIALSLATDLGTGQPLEHGLRTCWLALAAADALGLDAAARSCTFHTALLRFVGCTSDAADTAALVGGDEIAFNASMAPMLLAPPGESMRFFMRHVAEDRPLGSRVRTLLSAMRDPQMQHRSLSGHCEAADLLAARAGFGTDVRNALAHAYERWDGKGHPDGLAGEDVPIAIRVVTVARDAEMWTRQAGWAAAAEVLAHRRDHGYDPSVVDVLLAEGPAWLEAMPDDIAGAVMEAEPDPVQTIEAADLDLALTAVADFADLKSPFFRGHSRGVAELAAAAALAAGLAEADAATLRRAALVHDVGRVGVAGGIWAHAGPLRAEQWERVRLHPYLTERVLHRSVLLAPFAALAGGHHERADGSGYHRGAGGEQLGLPSRVLAAADAYHAMVEDRPHRPAHRPAEAAAMLRADVDAGRFGRAEVDAVLEAAGHAPRSPNIARPAGLTEREVDVLRLIARGNANKAVAATLGISPKTVGHHIEHIYAKAGVTTRAGATLFAMEQGLLLA